MYCRTVLRRRQREELWEMERVLSWARDFSFFRRVHYLAAVSLFASAFCNLEWQKRLRKTRGLWAALQTWAKKMSNKTHEARGVAFLTLRNLLGITIPMLIHYWYIPSQFAHPQPNTAQDQPDQKKKPGKQEDPHSTWPNQALLRAHRYRNHNQPFYCSPAIERIAQAWPGLHHSWTWFKGANAWHVSNSTACPVHRFCPAHQFLQFSSFFAIGTDGGCRVFFNPRYISPKQNNAFAEMTE